MGKGAVPMDDSHCLCTMGLGRGDYNNLAFDDSDLVIAVGYDLVEYSPEAWNRTKRDKKNIHVDFYPAEVERDYPTTV
jgi:acetolactate synthase-1/2/3 large subunit